MLFSYICAFAVSLFIHEMGHLVVALACGVAVYEFGMGWGPELVQYSPRTIKYRLHLLPVGAYVRLDMKGLQKKPLSQQVAILLGGIIVNLSAATISYGTVFSKVNFLLAASNILPLYQQDGWKCGMVMLRASLSAKSKASEWVFTIAGSLISLLLLGSVILRGIH